MEQKVLDELVEIYSEKNLEKDSFFREMTQQHPEGWITLKKLSLIKRFKILINGDISILIAAANLAPEKFEISDDKTKLRAIAPSETEQVKQVDEKVDSKKDFWLIQNRRSIYAKGLPCDPEPTKADLMNFFQEFGRVIHIKYRREDDKTFKGSIFVEFETNEMAASMLGKEHCYEENDLLVMNKQDYVDMKSKEKYDGAFFTTLGPERRMRHFVEFSGADGLGPSGTKELFDNHKVKVGRFEFMKGQKGVGVVQLYDDMTADQFLATLEDNNKLGPLTFRLASEYIQIARERRDKNNNSRGRGRTHGRFKRRQSGKADDKHNEKRHKID
ncbi:hypothetical protein BC941DRAFT_189480 [Chlamydoabsidia padenii]|nr:hypothetical protein BC941DRAFT_189480 [Chlamydoabsidia padenii]